MFPADFPFASFNRTSVRELQDVPFLKKKDAASSVIIQSSRNRMGHVMAKPSSWKMLQTPRGFLALSLVQLGTLLLNGHSRLDLYRSAFDD
jgi:hypothetical protein